MPLIFEHAQQPPAGHEFPDSSGHTIRAKTLKELLTAIRAYREANGQRAGNPEKEVESHYTVHYPWLISKVGDMPAPRADPVQAWLNHTWRQAPRAFVSTEKALSQIADCLACPHYNSDYQPTPDQRRRLQVLSQGRLQGTGTCKAHNWFCGLATLLDSPATESTPEGCWHRGGRA